MIEHFIKIHFVTPFLNIQYNDRTQIAGNLKWIFFMNNVFLLLLFVLGVEFALFISGTIS